MLEKIRKTVVFGAIVSRETIYLELYIGVLRHFKLKIGIGDE